MCHDNKILRLFAIKSVDGDAHNNICVARMKYDISNLYIP